MEEIGKNTSHYICAVLRLQSKCYRLTRHSQAVGFIHVTFLSHGFKFSLLERQQKIKVVSQGRFRKCK